MIRLSLRRSTFTILVLIGHSYGADDEIVIAKRLNRAHVPVALLISLDHTKPQKIPPNVKAFYNLSSGASIMHSVIAWGCILDAESNNTKIVNVDLLKDKRIIYVNHFNIDKLSAVHKLILEIIKSEIKV